MTVSLDGFDPDMELAGYLTGVKAAAGEFKHLQLAIGKRFNRRRAIDGRRSRQPADNLRGDGFVQEDLAGEDAPDSAQDATGGFLFGDVTPSASAQHSFSIQRLVMHGHHEHQKSRPARFNVLN